MTDSLPDADTTVEPLLAVADLDRSVAFWTTKLGARVLTRWESYALLALGRGRLHLALKGDPPPDRAVRLAPPAGPLDVAIGEVVLRVSDCLAVVAALQARGVELLGPPARPAWGGETRAFGRDPDGHLFEISGPG